jgi:hypothetical protein
VRNKTLIGSLTLLVLLGISASAGATPKGPPVPQPVPTPGGGTDPCSQCKKACYDEYQWNLKNCGSSVSCKELARDEYDACYGNCLADVC